ncbi:DUF6336 family protein [Streptomyces africanus]|uniref:DUF6336 family protein n=1 Tax=Streptomyces africanus TaxID=231024 RepID=UPI000A3C3DC7|nr:DUF6336 family protein [Streptomyces africanus]
MALDQDCVMLPRLRPADIARRGVTFGLLSVVPLVVAALSITGHSDRREFLAVVGGLVGLFGAILLAVGAGFWWASAGDIRRCGNPRPAGGHVKQGERAAGSGSGASGRGPRLRHTVISVPLSQ